MTGSALKPEWGAVKGVARACIHTRLRDGRVRHEHGTYNRALLDRCRCRACTIAMRRRAKLYRLGLRPVLPPMVPATVVAEHIERLRLSGVSYRDVAERSGLSYGSVRRYAYLREGRCRLSSVEGILAIPAAVASVVSGAGYVDATGTRRRLQALAVLGWPLRVTAERMGLSRDTLTDVRLGRLSRVRAATATRVAGSYRRMVVEPPRGAARSRVSEARSQARGRGWVGPMAWDSVSIDDPAAVPCLEGVAA